MCFTREQRVCGVKRDYDYFVIISKLPKVMELKLHLVWDNKFVP